MNEVKPEVFATIKNLFATKTRRRLFENFLSLSFLQFANYIFPLITLPYLVRVLGPEKYGLIAFAQAFIGYFQILTDYGFNLSATREISINRENKEKVSEIFSSVIIIKFFLLLLSLGLMTIIVFSFEKFRRDWLIYYLTFGMVLGQTLFPIWFFQGMERMRYITFLNVLAKLIFTIAIFIFVKKASDYLYVPLLNSLGFVVAGVLALWIVFRDFGVFFRIPSFKDLKFHLKEGWHVFVSLVFITGYTNSRIFAVGLFSPNNAITGYYAIAEKLMGIVQTFPLASVIQTLYPRLSKIYAENKLKAKFIADKLQRYTTIAYLIICITFFIIAPKVVEIVAGSSYEETILTFRLLLIAVLFINANAFRVNFLLVSGNADIFAKIHLVMGTVGSIMVFLFCYFFSYIGTAISIILIELIVLIQTIIEDQRIWRTYTN
jgi:PST family polysaccharide transporter